MKAAVATVVLVAVVIVASIQAATEPTDLRSEGGFTVAQRFCPNGRC
jgi:hypothetical protein